VRALDFYNTRLLAATLLTESQTYRNSVNKGTIMIPSSLERLQEPNISIFGKKGKYTEFDNV
jgi:hypothetical protein